MYKLIGIFLFTSIVISSCREPNFELAQSENDKCGITMHTKYSKGMFSSFGGFELMMINSSGDTLKNCYIILDEKYKHTLNGLHTKGKGMIKTNSFLNGDTLIIPFHDDIDNLIFFNVPEGYSLPNKISIECNDCKSEWAIE